MQVPKLEFGALPIFAPLVQIWNQIQAAAPSRNLDPAAAEKIFGRELKTSVSGLEDFAACPFKFFAARGLRLEERKEFQFDARDKGSFQHEILQAFHERVTASHRRWRDLSADEAAALVEEIAREILPQFEDGKFLANNAARFTGEVLIQRTRQLVAVLVNWMRQYKFDPAVTEISFGLEPDQLPAWRIQLGDGHALLLRGRIDRVDLFALDENSALAVVMDYKSSARKLHPVKL